MPFSTPISRVMRVARQPLGQRLDHRDAAGHRRLEAQRHAGRLRRLGQRLAVARQHRLVGGDEVLAAGERRLGGGLGRPVLAAHRLDHEVDVVAPRQRHGIVLPAVGRRGRRRGRGGRERAETAAISTGRPARAAMVSPCACSIRTTPAADGAEAGEADAERLGHCEASRFAPDGA